MAYAYNAGITYCYTTATVQGVTGNVGKSSAYSGYFIGINGKSSWYSTCYVGGALQSYLNLLGSEWVLDEQLEDGTWKYKNNGYPIFKWEIEEGLVELPKQ